MTSAFDRQRFAAADVARLATVTPLGDPHLVPVVFALDGNRVWMAVDAKPKSTRALQRLANLRQHPRVSLLVDHYEADWSTLWWVRADGAARVVEPDTDEERQGIAHLVAKYPQYQVDPPGGPVVVVDLDTWRSWSAVPGQTEGGGRRGV
ncbi:TIGR03668 family PPOX class F420-dependent oxidoreductase [Nostocoides sp. HKS02]|uniref:TIGR03668 family PPOX class F420-dependent oxidoreductase n=1 Tax=Nostocoides sp. HKS02 TaxID=1813880 RepID=UPI0012B46811|nr:TIGR03668 family PPOX class F420-dependent oxidoreductase [Tetrasphaera sp. HKS02]QGN57423.1 TIGR03668 family PPOX class F420-dependent oxidoreductase [Tetrasphaera sp. HKS02]